MKDEISENNPDEGSADGGPVSVRRARRLSRRAGLLVGAVVLALIVAGSALASSVSTQSVWPGSQSKDGYVYDTGICSSFPLQWHHHILTSLYGYTWGLYDYSYNVAWGGYTGPTQMYWGGSYIWDTTGHFIATAVTPGALRYDFDFPPTVTPNSTFSFDSSHPVYIESWVGDAGMSINCSVVGYLQMLPL